jgi:catechol 2,3-dioxygenase-like lactoylglutathione lyase family enzyme
MGKIIPEILCSDLTVTREFYVRALGFAVLYERPAETFIYFSLKGADLMVEQVDGPGRRWITGELSKPFGRGLNLQIEVEDVADLYARVLREARECIYVPLEQKIYPCGDKSVLTRQFVIQDPDGYLLRFAQDAEAGQY